MDNAYIGNAGTFLVETLLGLYIMAVMLRFIFQLVRADFYNPITQFLVKLTDPPLQRLQRLIPRLWGVDLASVVLLLVLQSLELWIVFTILGGRANPIGVIILSMAELLGLAIHIFMFSIIIHAIMSWINPHVYNPMVSLLYSLTEPLLGFARRFARPISGLDLSPIVVIVGLQLLMMLFVAPIMDVGKEILLR
uniref:YggT family protein n=1 Tax=Candidatus Kentrum sp. TC TaxID=2126339 RepID=A0A451A8V4_9GAMM|nr:MAG: YggT family protein [Candidatus Kentron sp. TC]VFK42580.1 MAG: YggT family protein [Candidatus Kentron sp. TC]VFK62465.1 MAG: YggT family protein [Candidatus Kentron sp. TC]